MESTHFRMKVTRFLKKKKKKKLMDIKFKLKAHAQNKIFTLSKFGSKA